MTIRNLHHALEPRSVAVIGASDRPGSPGQVVFANILAGGFEGPIWPVNPRHASVADRPAYRSVEALPGAPDLAVIAAPVRAVAPAIAALGARGTRTCLVLGRPRAYGEAERRSIVEAARPHLVRVIGPGASGLSVPGLGLNAQLATTMPRPGRLALVSQSGAVAAALTDWAAERGIGFSTVVSLGAMADVDTADYLDLLAGDRRTSAILLFIETVGDARKFMSAARAASRLRPVIALAAGRHAAGAEAAALHTGALAEASAVTAAALARAGVLQVAGLAELFEAAEVVGRFRPAKRGRLAILTNGGGAGVLAADRLMDAGGTLAALAPTTIAAIDAVIPAGWSRSNPLDLGADAGPDQYAAALGAAAADPGVDAALVLHCPTGLSEGEAVARAVASSVSRGLIAGKPVLSCWLGGAAARPARALLREAGIASYDAPAAAAAAAGHLTAWGAAQAALLRVPDRGDAALGQPPGARETAAAILARVADEGRRILLEPEANAVLAAYGIPVLRTEIAPDPAGVGALAAAMLGEADSVAVKLLSRDVVHKARIGGVALDLRDPAAAEAAAEAIAARLRAAQPGARLDGFILQPMYRRAMADEVIAGIGRDRVFGPVIVFGTGGVRVEALRDTAIALPPLDGSLAGDLIARTRIGSVLWADTDGAASRALRGILVALSHLAEDFPAIRGVDVNPLLASETGAVALDARIEIEPGDIDRTGPNPDFAIRPYPAAWTRAVDLGGSPYTFRAIRPSDAYLYPAFLEKLAPDAIRMRFLAPRRHFPDEMGLRLSQLDYDRDMAFVAIDGGGALAGVARLAAEPDRASAEYALIVRSDLAGQGLGSALMRHLIDYARAEGFARLEGAVLRENAGMIALITRLGFRVAPDPEESALVATRLDL